MPAPEPSKQKSFSVNCVCHLTVNGIYRRLYASNTFFKPSCTLVTEIGKLCQNRQYLVCKIMALSDRQSSLAPATTTRKNQPSLVRCGSICLNDGIKFVCMLVACFKHYDRWPLETLLAHINPPIEGRFPCFLFSLQWNRL